MAARQGYKHSEAFNEGLLAVSELHQVHYEEYGRADGKPVVYVHGGPGGSATYRHTVYFNPTIYRVVLFDQRGAGKSLPSAELRENTSQHLVNDIEILRKFLGIPQWSMVFGGSWGSFLSLFYAQTHPESVGSLVLRGIFTERKAELRFSRGSGGAARVFPEDYEVFSQYLPPEDRHDPLAGYYKLVTSSDPGTVLEASKRFCHWDQSIMQLVQDKRGLFDKSDDFFLQHAKLETHYGVNGGFVDDGHLLRPENLARIKSIPCKFDSPINLT